MLISSVIVDHRCVSTGAKSAMVGSIVSIVVLTKHTVSSWKSTNVLMTNTDATTDCASLPTSIKMMETIPIASIILMNRGLNNHRLICVTKISRFDAKSEFVDRISQVFRAAMDSV
jgi:hypothetical protein